MLVFFKLSLNRPNPKVNLNLDSRRRNEVHKRHKKHFIRHQRPGAADRSDSSASSRDLQCKLNQDHDRQHKQS